MDFNGNAEQLTFDVGLREHVLDSDHVPSAEEVYSMNAEIEKDALYLEHLDICVSRLEENLDQARLKRDIIARRIERNKSVNATIRRLPDEVLGLIFAWCLEPINFTQFSSKSQILSSRAPILFTRICRKWRRVAFYTPQLWTILDIGTDSIQQLNMQLILPYWVEFSGSFPLDIRFDLCFNGVENLEDPFLSINQSLGVANCALLQQNMGRCRTLILSFHSNCGSPLRKAIFCSLNRPVLTSLETLIIDTGGWDICRLGKMDSPNLRLLCIEGCVCDLPRLRSSFPSSQNTVETLVFTNAVTNISELVTFIGAWSSLVNCHIGITVLEESSTNVQLCIFLPALRSLHVDWFRNLDPITSFLSAFVAPSLESLDLQYENEFEEDCGIIDFRRLMYGAGCQIGWTWTLKELKLTGLDANGSDIMYLLQSCVNLEKLKMRWCEGTESLLRGIGGDLTPVNDKEPGSHMTFCCPNLTSLELEGVFDTTSLQSIVDNRIRKLCSPLVGMREKKPRLERIVVIVDTPCSDITALKRAYPDVISIIQDCSECGLTEPGAVVKRYYL